jgi:phage host-nuclease inhibitor protein Gam
MSTKIETNTITAEEAREAAKAWSDAEFALQKIESSIKQKQAEIAAKHDEDIADHTLIQNDAKKLLMVYTEDNRDELMSGKAKSFELMGVKLGYKLKPASLLLKKAKDSWTDLRDRLKETTAGRKFLKKATTVDKTALKKADADFLKEMGVCVEQVEDFFIKL